jgi:hypothetical protein
MHWAIVATLRSTFELLLNFFLEPQRHNEHKETLSLGEVSCLTDFVVQFKNFKPAKLHHLKCLCKATLTLQNVIQKIPRKQYFHRHKNA